MSPVRKDIAPVNGQYGITYHKTTVLIVSKAVLFNEKFRVVQVRSYIGTRKFAEIPNLYFIINFEFCFFRGDRNYNSSQRFYYPPLHRGLFHRVFQIPEQGIPVALFS